MSNIAAQLYTLRDFTKTPADIASTFARVRKIGYTAVQVSGMGPIEPKELAKILLNEGLTCCATHNSRERLRDHTQAVIDEHLLWGCGLTAIGGFFPRDPTREDWLTFAHEYNQIAQKFAGSGLKIGYHNHSHELVRYVDKAALQLLIDHLDPSIWFEIDTYWITHGGGDPIQWINKVAGRIPAVHLKDMARMNDGQQVMAEVGEGNLNWPGIFAACKAAGVKWYIIEQDICQRDPFESLEISLKNVQSWGLI